MILSGAMPKDLSAGGKTVREELIQSDASPFRISEDSSPEIKPQVAASSSFRKHKNSCTAPKGNKPPGNASFIFPNPGSNIDRFTIGLCPFRISFCNRASISAFVASISRSYKRHLGLKY